MLCCQDFRRLSPACYLLGLTDAHAIYVCGLSGCDESCSNCADMDWVYTSRYFCKQTLPLTWERNSAPMLWRSGMAKFVRMPAV